MLFRSQDYEKVRETDRISILGLKDLAPKKSVTAVLHHSDGSEDKITLNHSMTEDQIGWFKAGSALNLLAGVG